MIVIVSPALSGIWKIRGRVLHCHIYADGRDKDGIALRTAETFDRIAAVHDTTLIFMVRCPDG